jgi:hypothetical protein
MAAGFSAAESQAAGAELAVDEAAFCDASSVIAFLTEEHTVIDQITAQ